MESSNRRGPTPGSAGSETAVRLVAAVAVVWGGAYLTWRLGWTWRGANAFLYVVLVTAEIVGWISLFFYTFLAWRSVDCPRVPVTKVRTVDVLVPTYDEPVEILRATLLGCAAITHPHRTWLLDDGRRPPMAELARAMGVEYVTRDDNTHAKAGNINNALEYLDGELIAVLDADHVPLPDFLNAMVGHFDDPEVVLAQAPHEFSNLDSVQHIGGEVHEQSLFFRVICPVKERDDAVFWCGSGTVIRRQALVEIGGVQTDTIAEDFHTSIVLHQRGWKTRYVDETVLLGLAPHDLDSFLLQRSRWARGNLRVLLGPQNPLWARGLHLRQRLSYLGSLSHYAGGPQRLALLFVLCATLLSGSLPLQGEPLAFAVFWAPWVLLSLWATRKLGRGYSGPLAATRYGWVTMGTYTGACLSLLFPVVGGFKVTPKAGVDPGGVTVLRRLPLLSVGISALLACYAARSFATIGWVELPAMPEFALAATLLIGAFEVAVIISVLRSSAGHKQRRSEYRVAVDVAASIGGELVNLVDMTPGGAGLIVPTARAPGGALSIDMIVPGLDGELRPVEARCRVRSCRRLDDGAYLVGVQFTRVSDEALHRITEYCRVTLPTQRLGRLPANQPDDETPKRRRSDGILDQEAVPA
ncbi:MAG: glycosyltransferase family 2 protein [Microthrixaceae bacterium]